VSSSPTERKQLVTFGVTMAIAFAIAASIRVWRRGVGPFAITFFAIAALLALATLVAPAMLAPIRRLWMRFAEVLGWINTRILLILIFYLVVTPLGLVMRLFLRPPLDMAWRDSYWTEPPRNSYGDRHYEKQF